MTQSTGKTAFPFVDKGALRGLSGDTPRRRPSGDTPRRHRSGRPVSRVHAQCSACDALSTRKTAFQGPQGPLIHNGVHGAVQVRRDSYGGRGCAEPGSDSSTVSQGPVSPASYRLPTVSRRAVTNMKTGASPSVRFAEPASTVSPLSIFSTVWI